MDPQQPIDAGSHDDLRQAQAQVAALTAELRAVRGAMEPLRDEQERLTRFRNTLATIRSVFRRTVDTAGSLEDLALHFTGRFDALVRFDAGTMTQRPVEVEDVIRDELLMVGECDGVQIEIAGPPVALASRAAPLIALAIHELVTNSVKFGALMTQRASLAIRWHVEHSSEDRLHLTWTETNVPVMASAPMRSGFGREFIEQALPYQLNAETSFELRPGGLRCEIVLPLGEDAAVGMLDG